MAATQKSALERAIQNPQPVAGIQSRSPVDGLDRRSVGFVDVLSQSVSAVAPSAAATTMPLLVATVAGGATVWALGAAMLLGLWVTVVLMAVYGYLAAHQAGVSGWRAAAETAFAALLGLFMVALNTLLH